MDIVAFGEPAGCNKHGSGAAGMIEQTFRGRQERGAQQRLTRGGDFRRRRTGAGAAQRVEAMKLHRVEGRHVEIARP